MRHKIETERENLFDVNMVIAMRVRIEGNVVFEQLEKAFYKAVSSYEILNSRVIIEDNGDAYYVDCGRPQSSFSRTELGFEELINANERVRFRIENGEYLRAFLTPDGLVFLMHHLGGDGKSLLYFIETFMLILTGGNVSRVPFAGMSLQDLPKESEMSFWYKLFVRSWNGRWAGKKRVFGYKDMDKAFNDFWQNHQTKTEITEYPSDKLNDLLLEAKRSEASLTSYLTAAWLKDLKGKKDVGYAVDGRLSSERTMGNFATGIHIAYRYDPGMSIGENAAKINGLMRKKLADQQIRYSVLQLIGQFDPSLIDTLSLEAAGCYHTSFTSRFADIMCYGRKKRDLSITNLMRAPIRTDYGHIRIQDIAFVPPVVSYGTNLIGIITVNGKMIITRHTYA